MPRSIRLLLLLAATALATAACSSSAEELAEQIAEAGGNGNVEVDIEDETVSVSFEDESGSGSYTVGGGDVPDGFPVPLPDGGEVVSVFEAEGDTGVAVNYDAGRYGELIAFYEAWVSEADLPELQTSSAEFEGMRSTQWFSPPAGTFISVAETLDDAALVTINVSG